MQDFQSFAARLRSSQNLKAKIGAALALLAFGFLMCVHRINTDPGFVSVLVDKPWFFGHGGVKDYVQLPGTSWYFSTTDEIDVATFSFKIDEAFDDLPTSNQSFIDFHSFLKLRVTDPIRVVKEFGFTGRNDASWFNWYNYYLKEQYRTIVRNEAKTHTMEDILIKPAVTQEMETHIREQMNALIKSINIPVVLEDLSLGKAMPNKAVQVQIDETAAQLQRVKTMATRKSAEDARAAAETAAAFADKAYNSEMRFDTRDVVQIKIHKLYAEACAATNAHCTIIMGNMPVLAGSGGK